MDPARRECVRSERPEVDRIALKKLPFEVDAGFGYTRCNGDEPVMRRPAMIKVSVTLQISEVFVG